MITGAKGCTVANDVASVRREIDGVQEVYELPLPALVGVKEGINLPRYPSVPGRIRAKSKPVAGSNPERPAQRLEMIRLVVPQLAASEATVLGHGPDAASAVVDMLASLGVL